MNHNQSSKTVLRIIRGGCLLLIVDVGHLEDKGRYSSTYQLIVCIRTNDSFQICWPKICIVFGLVPGWFQVGQREDQRIRGRKLQTKALDVFLKVSSHA